MTLIVPAVLEDSLEGFNDKVLRITKVPGVERIQVDFGDGIFIPRSLVSVSDIDPLNPAFLWEAHLMIKEPKDFFDYKVAGFQVIIIHYEAYSSTDSFKEALEFILKLGLSPTICLKNETPMSVLEDFKTFKNFQLMGVEPGAQGSLFLESTFNRIKELRNLIPGAIIEIDGGVSETNIKQLVEAGADMVIAGSALQKRSTMAESFQSLQNLV